VGVQPGLTKRTNGVATTASSAASGTSTRNVDGEAIALTVFSTVRWWGPLWLPLFFLFIRRGPNSLKDLKKLSFIHAARWSLVRHLPSNGAQPETKLRYTHLYFESNFNGGWEEYIDAFSHVLKHGMWAFWGSSYGFPHAVPAGPFKDYIRRNEYTANHYYSAYPDATATTVLGALELTPKVADLKRRASTMSPESFRDTWERLITDLQSCL
jgi:hypothetical protein